MATQRTADDALPRKRITAGVLIRNEAGQVLLVEPTYRSDWLTPGGTVEAHESPRQGAEREALEELGLPVTVGRALVMQWSYAEDDPDGSLNFAYDGGVLNAAAIERIQVPPVELASYRFVDPDHVPALASAQTADRVNAAIGAVERGTFVEIGP